MNILDIIEKKKNNQTLNYDEINFFVNEYLNNNIKDYQMSSLLMAIVINGMSDDETFNLTDVMLKSGDIVDLNNIDGIKIDKHSTGGVGDKTSLVVLPLVASTGIKIAKMSGRGLGFTGGTIDKLESIENFKTSLNKEEFSNNVNTINIALTSQNDNLVPADKKIYALRDVSGTTESIPLIASSIMSKKLASGSDKILLDVKVGKGAFMKSLKDAKLLASLMVKIGKKFNKETVAVISNMEYPLGRTIGNALEVKEAIDTLDNKGEENFLNLCLHEASLMVSMVNNIPFKQAYNIIKQKYEQKEGLKKLKEFINMQGGNINNIRVSAKKIEIKSNFSGYINDIDTLKLAKLCNSLGAGRQNKDDVINHEVGLYLNKIYGEKVDKGETIITVYTNKNIKEEEYLNCFKIENKRAKKQKIIYDVIK